MIVTLYLLLLGIANQRPPTFPVFPQSRGYPNAGVIVVAIAPLVLVRTGVVQRVVGSKSVPSTLLVLLQV